MTNKNWKIILNVVCALLIAIGFFFLGRLVMPKPKIKIVTEYKDGEPIEVYIDKPYPVEVIKPIDTLSILQQVIKDGLYVDLFPHKPDTVYNEKGDTSKILEDWATKRIYQNELFSSDTLGICTLKAEVQYNRLRNIDYSYKPKIKTITETVYMSKKFSPFIGGGFGYKPRVIGQVGAFINDKYGFAFQYQYGFEAKDHSYNALFMYKF